MNLNIALAFFPTKKKSALFFSSVLNFWVETGPSAWIFPISSKASDGDTRSGSVGKLIEH
jgi:hypothetical protein